MARKVTKKRKAATSGKNAVQKRWTKKLVEFTPVSNVLLLNYSTLNPPMTTSEAMFVIQLMYHKRDGGMPFPGFKSLAARLGVTPTAARGYARSLEKKGYLTRVMRVSETNRFDLQPLFEVLEIRLAETKLAKRKPAGEG